MSILETKLTDKLRKNARFRQNQAAMQTAVNDFHHHVADITQGGSQKARERHVNHGKLLPRDRLRLLLDPKTPFLELSAFAAHHVYADHLPAAGLITGVGTVKDQTCLIIMNDATVKGGTYYPLTVKKHLRAQEIAAQNHLPCIYIVDSGGAYLPEQANVFPDKEHFGRIFYNQARMSAAGIPQIAVVMGSCTAGGAYVPAMADQSIMVKNQSTIFLGGPPLVKAATGEIITAEELGGSRTHCKISGVADYEAKDELEALSITRDIISQLNLPNTDHLERLKSRAPRYDSADLYGLIPADPRQPFDSRSR